ncbi:MAG: hypothetical protein ACE5HD_11400 [Acidobacteriota bacterium]
MSQALIMPRRKTTAEIMSIYRQSLENMREWLESSTLRLDEKLGILDAWQEELRAFYREHGHCYGCDRPLDDCSCSEPLGESLH